MSGFGKAMRFTSITMLCGGLALAAFPGTSGFFSKDEILAYADGPRRHVRLIFTVLGYVGALLTAIYTFRLIFRVLPGTPCKEAQELIDTGHVAHEAPRNPATGEHEDTDVGFPGAEHHIAEQSLADEGGDGRARLPRPVRRPGPGPRRRRRHHQASSTRSSPTRRWPRSHPTVGADWAGLGDRRRRSPSLGIGIAYFFYVAAARRPRRC